MVLCGIPALSQESLSFRSFENIFKEGISFTERYCINKRLFFRNHKKCKQICLLYSCFLDREECNEAKQHGSAV